MKRTAGHGIEVSVGLLRRSFPRGALTTVDVTVRSISRTVLSLVPTCKHSIPDVRVQNRAGLDLYPPVLHAPMVSNAICVARSLHIRTILPGHSLSWHTLVVLRGPRIVVAFRVRPTERHPTVAVVGETLSVTLTEPDAPVIRVNESPSLMATISTTFPQKGTILFADWYRCTPQGEAETRYWLPADGLALQPTCSHPVEWHILGGYLNHALGCADYYRAADAPATVPPIAAVPIPDGNTAACPTTE